MTPYLISAPVIALAATGAVTLVLAIQGSNPVWHVEPLNLSEAAALRDRGEVARLLTAGADPHATRPVRAGFLYQDPAHLTAVEAAVNADRPEILQLLLDAGLSLDGDAWGRVWCAASSDEMRRTLISAQPPDSSRTCPTPASALQAPAFAKE